MKKKCVKIFVGATGQHCGKTTFSIGLLHLLNLHHDKVGFIKPVGQEHLNYKGIDVDKDVALIAGIYGLEDDLDYMSPVVAKKDFTKDFLDGKLNIQDLESKILTCLEALENKYDYLVVEGTGHGGVGSIFQLSNAKVARLANAAVVIVTDGGIGKAYDLLSLNLALYKQENVPVSHVFINKLVPEKRQSSLDYLSLAFKNTGINVLGGLDYSHLLENPTLNHLSARLKTPLLGDRSNIHRSIENILLGAASTQRVVDTLTLGSVVVLSNTRDELLVTLASLYKIPDYRSKILGLVITGIGPTSQTVEKVLEDSNVPNLRVMKPIGEIYESIRSFVSKTEISDTEKITAIQKSFEEVVSLKPFLKTQA